MTESTDLALYDPKQFMELGTVMAKSGLFKDTQDAAQAAVKIMAGHELAISPIAAMRGIHIVKGKVELAGTTMAMLIRRSGKYDYRVTTNTDETCVVEFYEKSADGKEKIGETTWTVAMAVQAGLCSLKDGKPYARSQRSGDKLPWETYTRTMLFNRAMSEGARTHVPDVFGGPVYAEGEIGDIPEDVGAPATPPPPKPAKQETSQPTGPTPTQTEVVDGELVEEGAEEQAADQEPADAEPGDTGGSESAPAPSSDDGGAGDEKPEPGTAVEPASDSSPAITIDQVRERLGWNAGKTLIFLRKRGHLGTAAIKQPPVEPKFPTWESRMTDVDARSALALLLAVAEGKHECGPACDEKGQESS